MSVEVDYAARTPRTDEACCPSLSESGRATVSAGLVSAKLHAAGYEPTAGDCVSDRPVRFVDAHGLSDFAGQPEACTGSPFHQEGAQQPEAAAGHQCQARVPMAPLAPPPDSTWVESLQGLVWKGHGLGCEHDLASMGTAERWALYQHLTRVSEEQS